MQENDIQYIKTIIGAIEKIENFTESFASVVEFQKAKLNYDAVMLNFVVISEMVVKISDDAKSANKHVAWEQVKLTEDKAVHFYLGVDIGYIWRIIKSQLPIFKKQLQSIPI